MGANRCAPALGVRTSISTSASITISIFMFKGSGLVMDRTLRIDEGADDREEAEDEEEEVEEEGLSIELVVPSSRAAPPIVG